MTDVAAQLRERNENLARIGHAIAETKIAQAAGVHFAVGLSTAFGCTIEGAVSEEQVVRLAAAAALFLALPFAIATVLLGLVLFVNLTAIIFRSWLRGRKKW